MVSWPSDWVQRTLDAAGIPVTGEAISVMRAWKNSTPLPPYSNNPLGMPRGALGAPPYLNTAYAIFPSMNAFYAAFGKFCETRDGARLVSDFTAQYPYSAVWRDVSRLGWPGSATETDYPSALLDLTTQAYRDSVKATPAAERKTSGVVASATAVAPQAINEARSIADAARAITGVRQQVQYLIRRHAQNG